MDIVEVQTVVVGAGVIGLAVARELAIKGHEVVVLEKEMSFGTQTSSRNSEVIHAGLYYPKGSLKARLCVSGRQLLYDYCSNNNIPHNKIGKLLVSTTCSQEEKLASIELHARANGCEEVRLVTKEEINSLEPDLFATKGLFSPETGVVDSHGLMLQLIADIEANGGQCVFNSEVSFVCANKAGGSSDIELLLNNGEATVKCTNCINATGLSAVSWQQEIPVKSSAPNIRAYFAKGSYFTYSASTPFTHLVYPVPEPGGLGVHLTLDLMGRAKFGPDVEWLNVSAISEDNYIVDPEKKLKFYNAIKDYWPGVKIDKLIPDYAGIRPKVSGPMDMARDFEILGEEMHGIKGLVSLLGIESPGLTSSLAIAKYVSALLDA